MTCAAFSPRISSKAKSNIIIVRVNRRVSGILFVFLLNKASFKTMDSPVLSRGHTRPLEEMALDRDSLPAGMGGPPWPQNGHVLNVCNFMLSFHKAVWKGCSLSLRCAICHAFGWKFFLRSSLYWKSSLCKILPQSLSPHQSGADCRLQFCLMTLLQNLFHFNKFWVSRETGRQWKLYSACQTCCCAFFEIPKNGGKDVCFLMNFFSIWYNYCVSHSVLRILKGKVNY